MANFELVIFNVINQPWTNINLYVHRLLLSAARHWNLWEYFLFRVFYSWSDQKHQYYRRLGLRLAVLTSSFHIPFKCKQTRMWYWLRVRRYKCVIYFTRWILLNCSGRSILKLWQRVQLLQYLNKTPFNLTDVDSRVQTFPNIIHNVRFQNLKDIYTLVMLCILRKILLYSLHTSVYLAVKCKKNKKTTTLAYHNSEGISIFYVITHTCN